MGLKFQAGHALIGVILFSKYLHSSSVRPLRPNYSGSFNGGGSGLSSFKPVAALPFSMESFQSPGSGSSFSGLQGSSQLLNFSPSSFLPTMSSASNQNQEENSDAPIEDKGMGENSIFDQANTAPDASSEGKLNHQQGGIQMVGHSNVDGNGASSTATTLNLRPQSKPIGQAAMQLAAQSEGQDPNTSILSTLLPQPQGQDNVGYSNSGTQSPPTSPQSSGLYRPQLQLPSSFGSSSPLQQSSGSFKPLTNNSPQQSSASYTPPTQNQPPNNPNYQSSPQEDPNVIHQQTSSPIYTPPANQEPNPTSQYQYQDNTNNFSESPTQSMLPQDLNIFSGGQLPSQVPPEESKNPPATPIQSIFPQGFGGWRPSTTTTQPPLTTPPPVMTPTTEPLTIPTTTTTQRPTTPPVIPIFCDMNFIDNYILNLIYSPTYRKQLRPRNAYNNATLVKINAFIHNILEVNEYDKTWTVHLTFRQRWNDSRLQYNVGACPNYNYLTLTSAADIWQPDIFFPSEYQGLIHSVLKPNVLVKIYPNGEVIMSVRISITMGCDGGGGSRGEYFCVLPVSTFAYVTDELIVRWEDEKAIQLISNKVMSTDEFHLGDVEFAHKDVGTLLGTYSMATAKFHLFRSQCMF